MTNTKVLNRYLWILLAGAAASGCNQANSPGDKDAASAVELQYSDMHMPVENFARWAVSEENNFVKTKEMNEISYQLSFTPKELLAYNEVKSRQFTKEELDEAVKHYEGMSYFNLRMVLSGGSGELLKYKLASAQQY